VVLQRARFHFSNLLQLGSRQVGSYMREKLRVARDGELANLLGMGGRTAIDDASPSEESGINRAVQRANDQAVTRFKPAPYEGAIVIFKPQVNYNFLPDPKLGWGQLVQGGVEVVELPVNPHAMLVEPFVTHLAAALRERLDRCQALSLENLDQVKAG